MPKLTGKQWLYVGAGALALILLYRWYQSRAASSSTTDTLGTTQGASGSDFGQLAGQEQGDIAAVSGQEASDIAGLQSSLASAAGQEASDIGGVNAAIAASSGQEQADVAGLTGDVSALSSEMLTPADIQGQASTLFPGMTKSISKLQHELAKVMAGERKQGGNSKTRTHAKPTHGKTGGPTKGTSHAGASRVSSPHVNAGHPRGTAGHSVAARSHAPKRTRR